jgi:hypothetical protein
VLSNADKRSSAATFAYPYSDDPFARQSSAYLGPPNLLGHSSATPAGVAGAPAGDMNPSSATQCHLSCRLNFLMTESDLWQDKFVTFEQYAKKPSAEANQLRSKINKEQRETKRLSGLVTLTAVEKTKLQTRSFLSYFR